MVFLQKIFNNPQLIFDPLNFIGLLATVLISLYIFKSDVPFSYIKERHEKLIFPLFNLLEPLLYQKDKNCTWDNVFNIIENNKSLADGNLLSIYYCCKCNQNQKNFITLCSYIDHAYDKSCRLQKLKCRSIEYRILRKQYKNNAYLAFYILTLSFIGIIFLLVGLSILVLIIALAKSAFDTANDVTKIIILIFLLVAVLAFFKYIQKHW